MGCNCCKLVWRPRNNSIRKTFSPKRPINHDHSIPSLALSSTLSEEVSSPVAADFVLGSSARGPPRIEPSPRPRASALPYLPVSPRTPRASQPGTPRSIAMSDAAFSFADASHDIVSSVHIPVPSGDPSCASKLPRAEPASQTSKGGRRRRGHPIASPRSATRPAAVNAAGGEGGPTPRTPSESAKSDPPRRPASRIGSP